MTLQAPGNVRFRLWIQPNADDERSTLVRYQIILLSGYFQVAERFASNLTPFLGLIGVMGIFATAAFWSVGLYVLLGGSE